MKNSIPIFIIGLLFGLVVGYLVGFTYLKSRFANYISREQALQFVINSIDNQTTEKSKDFLPEGSAFIGRWWVASCRINGRWETCYPKGRIGNTVCDRPDVCLNAGGDCFVGWDMNAGMVRKIGDCSPSRRTQYY